MLCPSFFVRIWLFLWCEFFCVCSAAQCRSAFEFGCCLFSEYLVTEGRPAMNFTFFQKFVEGAAAGSYEERLSCHAVIVGRLFCLVYLHGSANVIS